MIREKTVAIALVSFVSFCVAVTPSYYSEHVTEAIWMPGWKSAAMQIGIYAPDSIMWDGALTYHEVRYRRWPWWRRLPSEPPLGICLTSLDVLSHDHLGRSKDGGFYIQQIQSKAQMVGTVQPGESVRIRVR